MASTYKTYTPTFSGFSTDPVATGRYYARGKMVHVIISITTDGTSNATTAGSLIFTVPFPSSTLTSQSMLAAQIKDNGTLQAAPGLIVLLAGSSVATCYRNSAVITTWTGSGSKSFQCSFVYEADNTNELEVNDSPGNARPAIIGIGQSNLGTGVTSVASDLESGYKIPFPAVRFYKHSSNMNPEFVTMNYSDNSTYQTPDQNGTYSLQFYVYPDIATAVGRNLYVVHHGIGNTGLAVEWKSTATIGDQYRNALFRTKAARNKILDADGIAPSFKFILMVHGEYDSRILAYANAYQTNLTDLITNFRAQSGLTTLPVILVRLNTEMITAPSNPGTYGATVQTAQDNVAAGVTGLSDVYIVNPDGATMQSDKTHYTVAGEHTIATAIINCATTNGLI